MTRAVSEQDLAESLREEHRPYGGQLYELLNGPAFNEAAGSGLWFEFELRQDQQGRPTHWEPSARQIEGLEQAWKACVERTAFPGR